MSLLCPSLADWSGGRDAALQPTGSPSPSRGAAGPVAGRAADDGRGDWLPRNTAAGSGREVGVDVRDIS